MEDPRGTTYRPRLRPLLRWVVPAWAAGLVVLGVLSLTLLRAPTLGLVLILLPLGLVALLVETFGYRSVEFGQETLTLRRWLFPDLSFPYRAVDELDEAGCRVGGRPLPWGLFADGEALARRFRALEEAGALGEGPGAGGTAARREARQKAAVIVVGLAVGIPAGLGVADVEVDPLLLLLALTAGGLAAFPVLTRLFERRS